MVDNELIQEAYNKMFEVSLILRKNVKLTNKIKYDYYTNKVKISPSITVIKGKTNTPPKKIITPPKIRASTPKRKIGKYNYNPNMHVAYISPLQ